MSTNVYSFWHPYSWISPFPRLWAYTVLFRKKLTNSLLGEYHHSPLRTHDQLGFLDRVLYFWSRDPTEIVKKNNSQYKLYLGSAKNAADLDSLQRLEIGLIVNATSEIPSFYQDMDNFEYVQIPILDVQDASLQDVESNLIEAVEKINNFKGNILVHCFMGASRSVSVICKYFMKYENMTFDQAYQHIRDSRDVVCMNINFIDDIKEIN